MPSVCRKACKMKGPGGKNNSGQPLVAIVAIAVASVLMALSITIGLGAGTMSSKTQAVERGVSLRLAEERSASIRNVGYDVSYIIRKGKPIKGKVVISFELRRLDSRLVIDFAGKGVESVKRAGRDVPFYLVNEHILVDDRELRAGQNRIEVVFYPDERPLHREDDYLYTLFVPDKARFALPCFDQPDIKARFRLTLDLPEDWTAVANYPLESMNSERHRRIVTFKETVPLSTYLFSFAAGRLENTSEEVGGRTITMYYLPADSAKVRKNSAELFRLHFNALDWLERYTGIPYPFAKFAFVLVPSFTYSGMEHPGAILYRAERVLLDENPTELELLRRASVISHETSHMWFGDLVTMKWFDDVWLKEAFAQFMADKIAKPLFPRVNHRLLFFSSHMEALYDVDRTDGTHPVKQPLENLAMAGSLYGNIIYHKPPVMLNQLEEMMGERNFEAAIREYLSRFKYSNATWDDLVGILDAHSKRDITSWCRVWVEEAGRPDIEARIVEGTHAGNVTKNRIIEKFTIEQRDGKGRGLLWPESFHILITSGESCIGAGANVDTLRIGCGSMIPLLMGSPMIEMAQAEGIRRGYVLLDALGEGYGFFRLDTLLVSHADRVWLDEPLARAVFALELWDNLLAGYVDPSIYVRALYEMLGAETEEINIQSNLRRFRIFFWDFLAPERRLEWAERFEGLFLDKMKSTMPPSTKRAFFKTFKACVLTDDGTDELRCLWKGTDAMEGLEFSEKDRCDMALELAVRGVSGWDDILEEQLASIKNPSLRDRFAFVREAASPVPEVRERFFEELKNPDARRHEPWVLEGLYYLHHPLRVYDSQRFITESLEMLEEIERTSDIFFPKSWIAVTMKYHCSEEAIASVRSFLYEHPRYPERLKRAILQAVDKPKRANRVRRSYRAKG